MVAVPGKGGAMENWGLLLFDETRFLVNEVRGGVGWVALIGRGGGSIRRAAAGKVREEI